MNDHLLSLLRLAELDLADVDLVISGEDPVVKTVWKIGEAASIALASHALALDAIWRLRTGSDKQRIEINVKNAVLSTARCLFLRQNGYSVPYPDIEYPTVGIYKCRDKRHVFINGGFPKLRRGILKFLECADNADSIAKAIEKWNAQELESKMQRVGLCCVVVRTSKEWKETEQGISLLQGKSEINPVTIEKIGDSLPQAFPSNNERPLSGIRVLDLTHVLAGPTSSMMLAEQGSCVMRINGPSVPSILPFVMDTGHGKLNVQLDLKSDKGKTVMWDLISSTDIITNSYRPHKIASLGFAPDIIAEKLREKNKGIIYVTIDCYGSTGPWSGLPGWEQLAQSATGLAVGHSSIENPSLMPTFPNDYITGYLASFGALAALLKRQKYGGSYHVKVSLCETAMWLQSFGKIDKASLPKEIMPSADDMLIKRTTPYGELSFFGHPVFYEKTKAKWDKPTVPIGHDLPKWC